MTVEEMDNLFDVLYNNITSNQAPGLNAYEKSFFLTKAQDEILKNYFNPKSKGNNTQDGFDANQKRQIDFSMLTTVHTVYSGGGGSEGSKPSTTTTTESTRAKENNGGFDTSDGEEEETEGDTTSGTTTGGTTTGGDSSTTGGTSGTGSNSSTSGSSSSNSTSTTPTRPSGESFGFESPIFDFRDNTKAVTLPSDIMMIINEMVEVVRGTGTNNMVTLQVVPIKFDEYSRLMSKPYKRPLKYQAWRLINSNISNMADIVIGPSDTLNKYLVRYIRRPFPIVVSNLDGLTIEGFGTAKACELDPILHEEILQRAVELAKIAWTNTGQDNLQAVLQSGQRSE